MLLHGLVARRKGNRPCLEMIMHGNFNSELGDGADKEGSWVGWKGRAGSLWDGSLCPCWREEWGQDSARCHFGVGFNGKNSRKNMMNKTIEPAPKTQNFAW